MTPPAVMTGAMMVGQSDSVNAGVPHSQYKPVRALDRSRVMPGVAFNALPPGATVRNTTSVDEVSNTSSINGFKVALDSEVSSDALPRRAVLPKTALNCECDAFRDMLLHAASPQKKNLRAAEKNVSTPTFGSVEIHGTLDGEDCSRTPTRVEKGPRNVAERGQYSKEPRLDFPSCDGHAVKWRENMDTMAQFDDSKHLRKHVTFEWAEKTNDLISVPRAELRQHAQISSCASSVMLDQEVFKTFWPLLDESRDYARLSGCRFRSRSFDGVGGDQPAADILETTAVAARRASSDDTDDRWADAKARAAPTVYQFARRLRAGEAPLVEELDKAFRIMMAESVRSAMIATCRLLDLWPPPPAQAVVSDDDCAFEDISAPLLVIAQRLWNDDRRRLRLTPCEGDPDPMRRRAMMATYIVEFANAAGAAMPGTPGMYDRMLIEFRVKAAEWEQTFALPPKQASQLLRPSHEQPSAPSALGECKTSLDFHPEMHKTMALMQDEVDATSNDVGQKTSIWPAVLANKAFATIFGIATAECGSRGARQPKRLER